MGKKRMDYTTEHMLTRNQVYKCKFTSISYMEMKEKKSCCFAVLFIFAAIITPVLYYYRADLSGTTYRLIKEIINILSSKKGKKVKMPRSVASVQLSQNCKCYRN